MAFAVCRVCRVKTRAGKASVVPGNAGSSTTATERRPLTWGWELGRLTIKSRRLQTNGPGAPQRTQVTRRRVLEPAGRQSFSGPQAAAAGAAQDQEMKSKQSEVSTRIKRSVLDGIHWRRRASWTSSSGALRREGQHPHFIHLPDIKRSKQEPSKRLLGTSAGSKRQANPGTHGAPEQSWIHSFIIRLEL